VLPGGEALQLNRKCGHCARGVPTRFAPWLRPSDANLAIRRRTKIAPRQGDPRHGVAAREFSREDRKV
jgi:hypothetical protein